MTLWRRGPRRTSRARPRRRHRAVLEHRFDARLERRNRFAWLAVLVEYRWARKNVWSPVFHRGDDGVAV
jgi:hypothetical protein